MGCMCTRERRKETIQSNENSEKKYTWDKRNDLNLKDYIVEDLEGQEIVKVPGSVNGQQFIIQNCKDSTVYILDHTNTITVDDCINCKLIIGPVKGSLFFRNSTGCTCVVACGQFRARDCRKIHIFLYSATQPVIETSSGINFIPSYQLQYKDIEEHLRKANLNIHSKNWKVAHDFTPIEGEVNWNLNYDLKVSDFIKEPKSGDISKDLFDWEQTWTALEQNVERNISDSMPMIMETTI